MKKAKIIDAFLVTPATILFAVICARLLLGSYEHFDSLSRLDSMSIGSIAFFVFYTLVGGIAILSLWALIIYPEWVAGLAGDQKQFFNLMMSVGFYICGMYYLFLIHQISAGLRFGYPPKEEVALFAIFALFCLGPLQVVCRTYYQWSFRKFSLVCLGATVLVLSVILIGVNAVHFLELPKY